MAAFLSAQLDFIFFFYGLAFILLGGACFTLSGPAGRLGSPAWLGSFALVHGVGEWLDLTALLVGDNLQFAAVRTAVMAASFLLLLEFARRGLTRGGIRVPGPWLHAALVLLVGVAGVTDGLAAANAVARYAIGFPGAAGTAWVFYRLPRAQAGVARSLAIGAALAFALYAVAAGAIVPQANIWPASAVNYGWFVRSTGIPIQLVRGLLACWMAFSIWGIYKRLLALQVDSERYAKYLRQTYSATVLAAVVILASGWTLTAFLGGMYERDVEGESQGNINLLASRLDHETAILDGMARVLAGSPAVLPMLAGGGSRDAARLRPVLDLHVAASGATSAHILDSSGRAVASSAPDAARAGAPRQGFARDAATGAAQYCASFPIRRADGSVAGAAVLKKSLDDFAADLSRFSHPYFLIDADGMVMQTNNPAMLLRTLWPLPAERKAALTDRYPQLNDPPMLAREFFDAVWVSIDGERHYLRRRRADHGDWSIVLVMPASGVFASRFHGIVITLLLSIMAITFLYSRERMLRDRVEMEKRLHLQNVARDLRVQATTDPLTGLSNRTKFDEDCAREVQRARRYGTPFSIVLFDVDRFKSINDTYGHQVGDEVLVELAKLVAGRVRSPDLLARWGGEEFVLLASGSDGRMACQAAERLRREIGQAAFRRVGTVTCSFGVAQYAGGDDVKPVVAQADAAMYRAKLQGRNRVELA